MPEKENAIRDIYLMQLWRHALGGIVYARGRVYILRKMMTAKQRVGDIYKDICIASFCIAGTCPDQLFTCACRIQPDCFARSLCKIIINDHQSIWWRVLMTFMGNCNEFDVFVPFCDLALRFGSITSLQFICKYCFIRDSTMIVGYINFYYKAIIFKHHCNIMCLFT